MIELILLASPVKPLCRFKLASKSWNSLISHPDFVAHHAKAAEENKDRRRRRFFINSVHAPLPVRPFKKRNWPIIPSDFHSLNLHEFLKLGHDDDNNVLEASRIQLRSWASYVHGSSWGIVLMTCSARDDKSYRCLTNPLTKELTKLPIVPKWRRRERPWLHDAWAFGFDQSANDYKVINGQRYYDGFVFSVYTLKTRTWRKIGNLFPYFLYFPFDAIMVKGHAHWLARKFGDFDKSFVIISFVFAEEKVREIELPPNTGHTCIKLRAFRDCLGLTESYHPRKRNQFWVMKEYGAAGESWTKMRVSIPYWTLSHSGFWTETHDLMVFNERSLVMCDFDKDEFRTLTNQVGDICGVGSYVETLATLTFR